MAVAGSNTKHQPDTHYWVTYYTGVVSALGLALLPLACFHLPEDRFGLLVFAAMATVAELLSVELFFRSRNSTVSVSGIVAIAGIAVLGPLAGVLIHLSTGVASALRISLLNRRSQTHGRATWLQRLTFNTGMWMIASAAAGGVYAVTGGTGGPVAWRTDPVPLMLASLTDILLNLALLIGVITLQTGQRPLLIWRSEFEWTVPITLLGSVVGGGILASAYALLGLTGIAIAYLPVVTTGYSFRLYTSHTRTYVQKLETLNTELGQANEQLRREDDLKDGLLRNVTHELKTPIAILSGYIEILRMDSDTLPPEQQEIVQIAATQADRVTEIVRQVIAIHQAGQAAASRETLNMVEVAQESLQTAEAALYADPMRDAGKYQLSLQATAPELGVAGNRSSLSRVLGEILNNAIKFSPDGGKICIVLSLVSGLASLPLTPGGWVQVAVSDQGIGMPDSELTRVWRRFYQVDMAANRRFGGTGLGLSIVKETVDAHGGAAWIESCEGKGTTVFIALPLTVAEDHGV